MLVPNEDWTVHVVGQMHKYRIKGTELAAKCIYGYDSDGTPRSYAPSYVSTVINGNKVFESAEAAQKTKELILSALDELVAEREKEIAEQSED